MFFAVAIVIVFLYIRALAVGAGAMSAARLKRPGLSWPVILVGCALLVAVCLFPFWWMVLSSVKTLRELYTVPPIWWPDAPTSDNYRKVLFESNIPRYFLNSVDHLGRLDRRSRSCSRSSPPTASRASTSAASRCCRRSC